MPRVDGPPAILEIRLKPALKSMADRVARQAGITQISRCIARRNIQSTAQSDRETLKISAGSEALGK
jgi:hypothetical protein